MAADGTLRWQADLGVAAAAFYAARVPVADGNTVVVGLPLQPQVAFDNRGITGCSGTPTTCQPMWSYTSSAVSAAHNGIVYGGSAVSGSGGAIAAFDANGVDGCSGSPTVCSPIWSTVEGTNFQAVDDHFLHARLASGVVAAFALDGTGCSGAPLVCQPRWTDPAGASGVSAVTRSSEAGGVLYTISHICDQTGCPTPGSWYVDGHDAAGIDGCSGTPKVCHSLFSKALPFKPDEVLVVGDVVYVTGDSGNTFSDPAPPTWGFRTS